MRIATFTAIAAMTLSSAVLGQTTSAPSTPTDTAPTTMSPDTSLPGARSDGEFDHAPDGKFSHAHRPDNDDSDPERCDGHDHQGQVEEKAPNVIGSI